MLAVLARWTASLSASHPYVFRIADTELRYVKREPRHGLVCELPYLESKQAFYPSVLLSGGILSFSLIEWTRPATPFLSCLSRLLCMFARSARFKTGTTRLSMQASSIYEMSPANAMPWYSESTSRSSDVATSRALLYKKTRHWVWYLASYAIMSPALSFARRAVSCNLTAHWLTRTSTWKVNALRKGSPTGGMPHNKHVSMEGSASSIDWRKNFLEASVLSSLWVLSCWIAIYQSHAIWLCIAGRWPQCTHYYVTLTGWLS